jgi:hypothetical protein
MIRSSAIDYRTLLDGVRHTLSVTWENATGTWQVFIDGALIDTASGLSTGSTVDAGGMFVFGQEQDAFDGAFETGQVFSGVFHDVRLFDDVRTPGEIAAGVQADLPFDEPNLVQPVG